MAKNLKDVVFTSALRTPIGKYKGLWKKSQAHELGKIVILNILQQTKIKPEFIIVDGNKFKSKNKIPYKCIVKGDSKYMSIAAASVLAKTSRDHYMINLSKEYPNYYWNVNKGYPTKKHKKIILENGITKHHRKTFKLN